jgi:hypothetical protein
MRKQKDAAYAARLQRKIAHRWLFWQPWAYRRTVADGIHSSTNYRNIHFYRIHQSLYHQLPWSTIVRSKLDDPLVPQKDFQFNLNAAVERRRQARERAVLAARNAKERHASRNSSQ